MVLAGLSEAQEALGLPSNGRRDDGGAQGATAKFATGVPSKKCVPSHICVDSVIGTITMLKDTLHAHPYQSWVYCS